MFTFTIQTLIMIERSEQLKQKMTNAGYYLHRYFASAWTKIRNLGDEVTRMTHANLKVEWWIGFQMDLSNLCRHREYPEALNNDLP